MPHAVAVDLGASSGRIALGQLVDDRIEFEIIEQITHEAIEVRGRLHWNIDVLLGLCNRALELAGRYPGSTLGIDSWGVDHGFLDHDGNLMDSPICYRDLSHLEAFERLAPHRRRLYELTGIQHQPFNTVCQLAARKKENPKLIEEAREFLILPDLLGYLLGGSPNTELTQCSTTQLMGLDGKWSKEAFDIAGWPVPSREPELPGRVVSRLDSGVDLVSVGSHDTASAVVGFGEFKPGEIFLNVGTWSLVGTILDRPIASPEAESFGFTNEWTVDGRIRFLKNIPGFYFINRLHGELGIGMTVPEWLQSASKVDENIDLFHPDFFNPDSMIETCSRQLKSPPASFSGWAGLALASLASAVARTSLEIADFTGIPVTGIRIGGGGSQSREFCTTLANQVGVEVSAGPAESTVLGNLAAQFLAQGLVEDWTSATRVVGQSLKLGKYSPE